MRGICEGDLAEIGAFAFQRTDFNLLLGKRGGMGIEISAIGADCRLTHPPHLRISRAKCIRIVCCVPLRGALYFTVLMGFEKIQKRGRESGKSP